MPRPSKKPAWELQGSPQRSIPAPVTFNTPRLARWTAESREPPVQTVMPTEGNEKLQGCNHTNTKMCISTWEISFYYNTMA